MDPNPSRWLAVLVGWLAATAVFEGIPLHPTPSNSIPACALGLRPGPELPAGPWILAPPIRTLRQLPGIGRKRARLLAEELRRAGMDPRAQEAGDWLLAQPGIGPVSAGAVQAWARTRYPLAWEEAVHFQAATWPSPNPNP